MTEVIANIRARGVYLSLDAKQILVEPPTWLLKPYLMAIDAWKPVLVLALLAASPISAQETPDEPYRNRVVPLPFASYTPETRLMFGGLVMYQFKPRSAGSETRASQILSSGIYTLNRQLILEFLPSVILPEERWLLEGAYQYAYFPNSYWGIGAQSRSDEKIGVEYRRLSFQQAALKKIGSNLYAGPMLRWSRLGKFELAAENGFPAPIEETIPGAAGSTLPGLGLSVRWDQRNSITAPTEKHYLALMSLYYPEILGASHPHLSVQLDGRKYLDIKDNRRSVLAFHFRLRMTAGELPFQEYSMLGGWEIMRGYFEGRFRDANAAQIQGEWRQHIYGRFGAAVFLAAGEVWGDPAGFSLGNPKYAGGVGLRFNLNPQDTNNIRIDYGIGRHGRGLYIKIGEAF